MHTIMCYDVNGLQMQAAYNAEPELRHSRSGPVESPCLHPMTDGMDGMCNTEFSKKQVLKLDE